ncbi:MAG: QueT transporter family protein [Clostridia bacterium]|nr:QueT transporter family protein [Clostridia bacterium]
MKNKTVYFIAQGAMVAALCVVLTLVSQALGLLSFDVQLRFSEALCVLPMFTGAAVPGLALGCVLGIPLAMALNKNRGAIFNELK